MDASLQEEELDISLRIEALISSSGNTKCTKKRENVTNRIKRYQSDLLRAIFHTFQFKSLKDFRKIVSDDLVNRICRNLEIDHLEDKYGILQRKFCALDAYKVTYPKKSNNEKLLVKRSLHNSQTLDKLAVIQKIKEVLSEFESDP